ncbi:uncharacterized protein L203_103262 [Cryptococcus depauperatus CBS 7841]|uniref:Galactosyl transferase GMA12/MNN10 family protein n=1 Tax=Cryptococcus depauperatus CBS 7841 TaxID=1295531 RepID=A0AAJ8M1I0_9TREE
MSSMSRFRSLYEYRKLLVFVVVLPLFYWLHRLLFLYYVNLPLAANPVHVSSSRPHVTILTVFHELTPLYLAARANHRQYAETHGYDYRAVDHDYMKDQHVKGRKTYNKIAHLIKVLLEVAEERGDQGWVLWTDADTFIVNPAVPLETFLPPKDLVYTPATEPFLLASSDRNGLNLSVMLIKANMWSVNLLSRVLLDPVLNSGSSHVMNDQASLSRILHDDPQGVALHYWDIPQSWLNNYQPQEQWEGAVQAHLVNRLKTNKSHFPYVERVKMIYDEAKGDFNRLSQRPEVRLLRNEAAEFWKHAEGGIEHVNFLLEG